MPQNVEIRTTGWVPVLDLDPPRIRNYARTQVVVTFPQRRGMLRMQEVVAMEEIGELPCDVSETQKALAEQLIVEKLLVRVNTLCEDKKLIPDGGDKPIRLGRPKDNFVLVDAEPADNRPHQILDPTETHFGLPNEQLHQEYVPKKPMIILGH
jgi:hypothetical protein